MRRYLPLLAALFTLMLQCHLGIRYDADGRFSELTVAGCPDEVVDMIEKTLRSAWRRSRVIPPEGTEQGLWLRTRVLWQVG